jgi:hypothetical protein
MDHRNIACVAALWLSALTAACTSSSSPAEGNDLDAGATGSSSGGGSGSSGSSSGAPQVATTPCSVLTTSIFAAIFGNNFQDGGWGSLPVELQQVLPGGTLCGTYLLGDASSLGNQITLMTCDQCGPEIDGFYGPLVSEMPGGCTYTDFFSSTLGDGAVEQAGGIFMCTSGAQGGIDTDPQSEMVEISYTAP